MKNERKIQIGVMGSAADLGYQEKLSDLAEMVGMAVAEQGAILVYGAEKDCDSLSTAACRGAKKAGGSTVGVTYGKGRDIYQPEYTDITIVSGLERGGGRELVLVLSCDAIITLGGGSGTLTEMAIAYQANIPIVAMDGSGGWSDRLGNEYIDERQRLKVLTADTPQAAVEKVLSLV